MLNVERAFLCQYGKREYCRLSKCLFLLVGTSFDFWQSNERKTENLKPYTHGF